MSPIRVLVVDDSITVRERFCEILGADPQIEIVGEAANGAEAIDLARDRRPDVVTLDIIMPVMTGLAFTEWMMAYQPTPILIVSSSTNREEVFSTYDALAAGAVDVLDKPSPESFDGDWERQFVAAVKLVSKIRVITHPRARLGANLGARPRVDRATSPPARTATSMERKIAVVAIGASTGGPAALAQILCALRPDFPLPILIVLHISPMFSTAFAEWLEGQTQLPVSYARHGTPLEGAGGRVIMAPAGKHLAVCDGVMRLGEGPERHSCRPSIDVLFESLALDCGSQTAACLLTGMGRDGASGLLALRSAGGATIAQDESTSVVYGMPGEAVKLGAAGRVLPLPAIGPFLAELAAGRAR
jgi:two-component system, chemotaxis family, protein-glutamate methylesterase/glutaminase